MLFLEICEPLLPQLDPGKSCVSWKPAQSLQSMLNMCSSSCGHELIAKLVRLLGAAGASQLLGWRSQLLQIIGRTALDSALVVSDRHLDGCHATAAYLRHALEPDTASPVAAGPVHESVHLRAGKARQENGLPVQAAAPCQERLAHTHDVRAVLRLRQLVQGLEDCAAPAALRLTAPARCCQTAH